MSTTEKNPDADYDVVIIGGGLSGINAAYRIQEGLPHLSYAILEARDVIGGTWSLFKYPGIRSDSEISSFAFPWAPWDQDNAIADGASILKYIENTATKFGIDKKIQFNVHVTHVDWQNNLQKWRITTKVGSTDFHIIHARLLILGTGYYDYKTPLQAFIPGLDKFNGDKLHPQFWPNDYDPSNKNIVVIGSGATAVTLVPALSGKAKRVTMLQRSPSHFLVVPSSEAIDSFFRRFFPAKLAYALIRIRILTIAFLFVQFCYLFPNVATKILRAGVKSELPPNYPLDPHFTPRYKPWEQRMCIVPDGDFFRAIRDGNADIVTDQIETIDGKAIILKSGSKIEDVDAIVTATGLKLHVLGGIQLSVDGQPVSVSEKFTWRSTCLQDVPNACYMVGYTDNAWTLGSDSTARLFVRLIQRLEKKGGTSFVPSLPEDERKGLVEVPMLSLNSGYVERAKHLLPKTASAAPWKPRWHYFWDYWFASYGNLERGMKMIKVKV